jgi:hypothetical protein
MLKELILEHGKQKINTLTKYPSILTLHKLGEKGRLISDFTTDLTGQQMFATEKIDGTNVRIICLGDQYLIGSREFLLHHNHDLYFDPAQGIVEAIKDIGVKIPNDLTQLTVIYGELYGGKVSSNSKQYGQEKLGFRSFDIVVFEDLSVLGNSLEDISKWREQETRNGIVYGQNFLKKSDLESRLKQFGIDMPPSIFFELGDMSHQTILDNLKNHIPQTNVALSDTAQMRPEGLVLRNEDRTKIVKLRFEDYEKTLKK